MLSSSKIEAQLSDIYTRTIFLEVQKELNKVVWYCTLKLDEDNDDDKVVHSLVDESYDCSCHNFVRNGILCRHVFKVMLNDGLQSVPEKYILPRWRRGLVPVETMHARASQIWLIFSPPSGIRNKGRAPGKGKRIVRVAKREANLAKKPKRKCKFCNKDTRHDSRN
ncbi:hypothetical protein OSB04_012016 [Centaurea solstitialis]|uniref:Protein FAR1-RELATED SEQUENCE n=1 Tax=Centaurea solstitialis TaxID=347529 RepID=A0AA38WE83_9ASTR|nr:hypothetical protein OSB04_012016 [Centaurea solstitialis]